ncbi:rRNA maturation RNase YbeY [Alloiococcus sp. CFN-8]|uniref:rRNA maturation RNase YbeY n=1 Tax=Alloiococcus sp. CFN-8 TaxID=3416081 RepID=UPI003CEC28FD
MIYIDDRQDKITVTEELIDNLQDVIAFTLKEEDVTVSYEVSVILVDNSYIKDINRENRGIDRETDVLSFPLLEYPEGKVYSDIYKGKNFSPEFLDGKDLVLGDIVLSLEKAMEQSLDYGHSFMREACYLTVHSVLHLLGYDHMKEEEKNIMRLREESVLDAFKLSRA